MGTQLNAFMLYILVAIAGATTIGSQIILYSYASQYYPIEIRSTGLGWASGIGRLGGILGPTLGGVILALNLPLNQNFMVLAIPAVIAAVAIAFINEEKNSVQTKEVAPKIYALASDLKER